MNLLHCGWRGRIGIIVGALLLGTWALMQPVVAAEAPGPEEAIGAVLDRFYETAAAADYEGYFALFAADGVFLGTDATERWTVAEFKAFVRPYFAAGRGWAYVPGERHVVVSPEGGYAWFDEALTSQAYGRCRGSGVMRLTADGWKVAQYHLTIPIPNDLAKQVVELLREQPVK